jgi:hypothetical protein
MLVKSCSAFPSFLLFVLILSPTSQETLDLLTLNMALSKIPPPESANLNNHYILGEIIEHVQEFADGFPHINFQELIDQITQVRNHNVDPEVQVRGFLKVFENTPFFQDELSKLDPTTRAQLKDFMKGSSAAEVVEHRHWTLRPSPGAKHHFSLLQFFESFGLHDRPVQYLETNGLPIIYEDAARTMVMEVSIIRSRCIYCVLH